MEVEVQSANDSAPEHESAPADEKKNEDVDFGYL